MDQEINKRVCPVERAGALDIGLRKLVHNPKKILKTYLSEGMTALDIGCGPGFFTIEMAKLVGSSGEIVGADLQDGMLEKVRSKIKNTILQDTIALHKCQADKIGTTKKFDFILVFYMLHEVPDPLLFLKEVKTLLNPDGKVLIAEPKFHVSQNDFTIAKDLMKKIGFDIIDEPKIFFSRSVILK